MPSPLIHKSFEIPIYNTPRWRVNGKGYHLKSHISFKLYVISVIYQLSEVYTITVIGLHYLPKYTYLDNIYTVSSSLLPITSNTIKMHDI